MNTTCTRRLSPQLSFGYHLFLKQPATISNFTRKSIKMRSAAARTLYIRSRGAVQARSGLVGSASESCRIFAAPTNNQLLFPTGTSSFSIRTFADFSMAQLKELRAMSGAPIVDCKKALGETSGNLEEAMDWLRKHGAAKAALKVSDRDALEGLVACTVSDDGKSASLVKVSSETDFAGKSQAFVDFVHHVANATLSSETAGSLDSEKVMTLESSSKSVKTALEEAIVAIRENLGVPSAIKLTTDDGILVAYVHGKVNEESYAGSSAAVVELVGSGVDPKVIADAGKKLAMHIVAAKPTYLTSDDIPSGVLDKERAVLLGQIADSNKPPEVQEKIIDGRLRKFYEEVCLTEQEHMLEEGGPKVAKALKALGLEVRRFEAVYI